jgi:hypothetical protein
MNIKRSVFHTASPAVMALWSTVLLLPVSVALLIAQYWGVFYMSTLAYSDFEMCQPRNFREAFRGWFTGICLTDEQLWCRVHGNQHPDCAQADCRAEEIRLTLYPIFFETVKIVNGDVERYGAMPDTSVYDRNNVCFDRIRQHILSLNTPPPLGDGLVLRTIMGVCVPSDDRRSMFLPICPLRTARCRSLFYRPWNYSDPQHATWGCGDEGHGDPTLQGDLSNETVRLYYRQQSYANQFERSARGLDSWVDAPHPNYGWPSLPDSWMRYPT